MIKFFRHIRKRMLKENRFTRYTLYAIGEIILVVIGILIALQINTWNEERKAEKVEEQVLKSLYKDLEQNRARLKKLYFNLESYERRLEYYAEIIWKDSLTRSEASAVADFAGFVNAELSPNRTTYDEMISTGKLYSISNQALTEQLIAYYKEVDQHIYYTRKDRDESRAIFYDLNTMSDFFITLWAKDEDRSYRFANDQDTEAYQNLKIMSKYSLSMCRSGKRGTNRLLKYTNSLQEMIHEELGIPQPKDEEKLELDKGRLKELEELLSSEQSLNDIIRIIEEQDEKTAEYDVSRPGVGRLGFSLLVNEKYDDARRIFELNMRLHPNDKYVYAHYGEYLTRSGDREGAIKAFEKALELDSNFTRVKADLHYVKEQGETQEP